MSTSLRALVAVGAAAALSTFTVNTASAAPKGDPNMTRTANPAQSCAAIPATLAQFGMEPEGFSFRDCVRTVVGQVPDVAFGDPYEQCAALEAGIETPGGFFQISYPYTFHNAPGDPFPDLRANNRKQCARALYTFHTLESYLGG
jgi:hypothetical protein